MIPTGPPTNDSGSAAICPPHDTIPDGHSFERGPVTIERFAHEPVHCGPSDEFRHVPRGGTHPANEIRHSKEFRYLAECGCRGTSEPEYRGDSSAYHPREAAVRIDMIDRIPIRVVVEIHRRGVAEWVRAEEFPPLRIINARAHVVEAGGVEPAALPVHGTEQVSGMLQASDGEAPQDAVAAHFIDALSLLLLSQSVETRLVKITESPSKSLATLELHNL